MARYRPVDRSRRLLPIVLEAQWIPVSFEHALDILIDTEIDRSGLAEHPCNDTTGAPAYDAAVMLKIVLLARSPGAVSSRAIERPCRKNVLFMAISGARQCSTHGRRHHKFQGVRRDCLPRHLRDRQGAHAP